MVNEIYDRKNCPVLKKCRHEAFFSFMKITEMIILLLMTVGFLYVAVKTKDMLWRIGASAITATGVILFFRLNFCRLRGLSETAKYLETLSHEDHSSLVLQVESGAGQNTPIYLLDGWLFAPSAPILTRYEDITDVEVVVQYYNGVKNSYKVQIQFRGMKREIIMNRLSGFDPENFKAELDIKMNDASSGYNYVFTEKKM